MKRLLSILLIGALSASLLTGCAAKDGAADKSNKSTKANNETSKPKEEKSEYAMKETVLADNEFYTFTVKNAEEYKDEKVIGIRLNVSITNKTEEALVFGITDTYINGYSTYHPSWDPDSEYAYINPVFKSMGLDDVTGVEVPGGETAEIFCQNRLEDYVGKIADEMHFQLYVDEKDCYEADSVTDHADRNMPSSTELYTIYPTGKNADTVEYPEPEKVQGEKLIEDNEYVKLIFQENKLTESGSSDITYYAENKSDVQLLLYMNNIKVNGKNVNERQGMSVNLSPLYSDKRIIDTISFKYAEGYPMGEEIKELSFTLTVNDSDSRSTLYTAEYTVTF